MAKHKSSTALTIKRALARTRHTVKPIVVKVPAAAKAVKHHGKRAARHAGGGFRGLFSPKRMGLMVGALGVGFLEKQGMMQQLPALPLIGRTGTIGVAAALLSGGKPGIVDDIATAALVIAAHELGSTGTIQGSESGWEDPNAVSGVDYVAGY